MGRTLPTTRMLVEQLAVEWAPYRRALKHEDREAFDSVFYKARLHSAASSFMLDATPLEVVLMSVVLEQEKELRRLKAQVDPE